MPRTSKNTFNISGDIVTISNPNWNFVATASIRDDYAKELQSVTWSKNGPYLHSAKLGTYLHVYIMKKWYGEDVYAQMKADNYIVDHMDNNGCNCCINNLCFLSHNENIAKGHTVDIYSKEKTHIALTFYKDFDTGYIQIAIMFNYPAIAKISTLDSPAVISLAYLLYDRDYPEVINDARTILYDYRRDYSFEPEKLHFDDYHIEGAYGLPISKDTYDRYIAAGHGHTVFFFNKLPPFNWNVNKKRAFLHLRGNPQKGTILI